MKYRLKGTFSGGLEADAELAKELIALGYEPVKPQKATKTTLDIKELPKL